MNRQSKMKILTLVPARGGSKGLPKKNITLLMGKPLIQYTIEAARGSEYSNDIVVSTESKEISEIAQQLGAWVPFLRPKRLSGDSVKTVEVAQHVINQLRTQYQKVYSHILLLQPTSPLRISDDISNAIELMKREKADNVVSLTGLVGPHPYKLKWIIDGKVRPFLPGMDSGTPRQELPQVFFLNGAVYFSKMTQFLKTGSFFSGNTCAYIMPQERSINIDGPLDLLVAECILRSSNDKWTRSRPRVGKAH